MFSENKNKLIILFIFNYFHFCVWNGGGFNKYCGNTTIKNGANT